MLHVALRVVADSAADFVLAQLLVWVDLIREPQATKAVGVKFMKLGMVAEGAEDGKGGSVRNKAIGVGLSL
jgi:hypothetical protein